jgi:glutathione S-transferase
MPDIILHHYPRSPYAEKVRLALGLKGLSYASVTVPVWMPKPDLMPLTGGYRRTPVMQVGADIFCDTQLILHQIERMHPEPSLFPGGTEALATTLGWGIERSIFIPAVGMVVGLTGQTYPRELLEDRRDFFGFSLEQRDMLAQQSLFVNRLHAHLARLVGMLGDGRPFLLGAQASAADLCAYHPLWHLRRAGGASEAARTVLALLPPLRALLPWMDRIAAIGHGTPRDLPAAQALAIARSAEPAALDGVASDPAAAAPLGVAVGKPIRVSADDSGRDPVTGRLVGVSDYAIIVRRTDPTVGEINVHFPRAGFDAAAA